MRHITTIGVLFVLCGIPLQSQQEQCTSIANESCLQEINWPLLFEITDCKNLSQLEALENTIAYADDNLKRLYFTKRWRMYHRESMEKTLVSLMPQSIGEQSEFYYYATLEARLGSLENAGRIPISEAATREVEALVLEYYEVVTSLICRYPNEITRFAVMVSSARHNQEVGPVLQEAIERLEAPCKEKVRIEINAAYRVWDKRIEFLKVKGLLPTGP